MKGTKFKVRATILLAGIALCRVCSIHCSGFVRDLFVTRSTNPEDVPNKVRLMYESGTAKV
jgi:hypothetical protein